MLEDFTRRTNFPYLHGSLLAINAIDDSMILIDGPDCSFFAAEHVANTHDLRSTLLDVSGRHRITHTGLHVDDTILGHGSRVTQMVRRAVEEGPSGPIVVSAWVMAAITGVEYEGVIEAAEAPSHRPVVLLPPRTLDTDWFDGFLHTLKGIARKIPLGKGAPDPKKVAVVGHFMHRNEDDQTANVAEMRALVEALGLELVSVWPEGRSTAELARVREAGTIFAMPYGRDAADVLGKRLRVPVVDVPVPFGLHATDRFLRIIAGATGREAEAEALIERQRADVAVRIGWLVPKRFMFRTIGFAGDPYLFEGLCDIADTLGLRVRFLLGYSRNRSIKSVRDGAEPTFPVEPLWERRTGELMRDGFDPDSVDLFVGNHHACTTLGRKGPVVEFGFPSITYHCTFDAPFLGYRGFRCFADRLAQSITQPGRVQAASAGPASLDQPLLGVAAAY